MTDPTLLQLRRLLARVPHELSADQAADGVLLLAARVDWGSAPDADAASDAIALLTRVGVRGPAARSWLETMARVSWLDPDQHVPLRARLALARMGREGGATFGWPEVHPAWSAPAQPHAVSVRKAISELSSSLPSAFQRGYNRMLTVPADEPSALRSLRGLLRVGPRMGRWDEEQAASLVRLCARFGASPADCRRLARLGTE